MICEKSVFGHSDNENKFLIYVLCPQFLAHSSQNPWNFLSVAGEKGVFCYINNDFWTLPKG